MEYRELQQECKKRGLKANGNRDELRIRIAEFDAAQAVAAIPEAPSEYVPQFVFVGDSGEREKIDGQGHLVTYKVDPSNPPVIRWSIGNRPIPDQTFYTFHLNGNPVAVDDPESASKLRGNKHFQEVQPIRDI